jgi:hypothetical protein
MSDACPTCDLRGLVDCDLCRYNQPASPDDTQQSCEVGIGSVTEGACPMVQPRLGFSTTTTGNSVPHLVGDAIVQCSITETTMENGVQVTRGRDGTAELLALRAERDTALARVKQLDDDLTALIDADGTDDSSYLSALCRAEQERDAALARAEAAEQKWREGNVANLLLQQDKESAVAWSTFVERLLHDLTPTGSEFVGNPKRCFEWVQEHIRSLTERVVTVKAALEFQKCYAQELEAAGAAMRIAITEVLDAKAVSIWAGEQLKHILASDAGRALLDTIEALEQRVAELEGRRCGNCRHSTAWEDEDVLCRSPLRGVMGRTCLCECWEARAALEGKDA